MSLGHHNIVSGSSARRPYVNRGSAGTFYVGVVLLVYHSPPGTPAPPMPYWMDGQRREKGGRLGQASETVKGFSTMLYTIVHIPFVMRHQKLDHPLDTASGEED